MIRASPAPRAVAWRWSLALFGALCSIPAVLTTTQNPSQGLALAIGVLAPAAVGVSGTRRSRVVSLIVSAAIGLGLVVGSALSLSWWLAVGGIFATCVAAAAASARVRFGSLLLMLAVPMVGAGLSFAGDVRAASELAVLMVVGGAYGWLLSLSWPERPTTPRAETAIPEMAEMIEYGVRLGLAGALCAGVGFALALDHVGWATAACLLVMRPTAEMTRLRGVGRAISVTAGAMAASLLTVLGAGPDRNCDRGGRGADEPGRDPREPVVCHGRVHHVPRDPPAGLRRPKRGREPPRRTGRRDVARRGHRAGLRSRVTGQETPAMLREQPLERVQRPRIRSEAVADAADELPSAASICRR